MAFPPLANMSLFPQTIFSDVVTEQNSLIRISSIASLQSIYKEEDGYMFLSVEDKMYNVNRSLASPGLLRELFARALGYPSRGNWRQAHNNATPRDNFTEDIGTLKRVWMNYFYSES